MNKILNLIKNFLPNIIKTINMMIKVLVASRSTLESLENNIKGIKLDKKNNT